MHQSAGFLRIELDVVLTHLVERIFKVVLNIIQAHEDEAVQDGHDIVQVRGNIFVKAGKVWPVDDGENVNEDFAVGSQGDGRAIEVNHFKVVESYNHFAYILANTRYFSALHTMFTKLHR